MSKLVDCRIIISLAKPEYPLSNASWVNGSLANTWPDRRKNGKVKLSLFLPPVREINRRISDQGFQITEKSEYV